jgi:hypothetical protein
MDQGFSGQDNQKAPIMPPEIIHEVSHRYIELYEMLTGKVFQPINYNNLEDEMQRNILKYL